MKHLQMTVALTCALLLGSMLLGGCSKKEAPDAAATAPPASTAPPAATTEPPRAPPAEAAPQPLEATAEVWSPEALEELLAPVALYPDAVLAQVLVASTNPQEVLDAGNWLIANPDLSGDPLDEAAAAAGFTPPMRALIQFPQVVDNMCLNLPWTEELGQAYVNDQAGVQGAVQRLRVQAQSVGNLESSEYMDVSTEMQGGQEAVVISPPAQQQVVYVPQYDPTVVYASPPASTPTTTTDVVEEKAGHSTGALATTGLLAFGAGILVHEIFDDDDDDYHYNWYGPMPYYPPYPYRPRYGGGFYPNHRYDRPNRYVRDNNVVVVNQNNNYFRRFDNDAAERRAR